MFSILLCHLYYYVICLAIAQLHSTILVQFFYHFDLFYCNLQSSLNEKTSTETKNGSGDGNISKTLMSLKFMQRRKETLKRNQLETARTEQIRASEWTTTSRVGSRLVFTG